MQYEPQQEFPIHLFALGVEVEVQGRKIAPHIIRINLIIAELCSNDALVCMNCSSMDITEHTTIEPEYKNTPVSYWNLSPLGSTPEQPTQHRPRRDRTEKTLSCNFCSHIVNLGLEWSDWYLVPVFEVEQQTLIINPWNPKEFPVCISTIPGFTTNQTWIEGSSNNNGWTNHTATPKGYGISVTNGTGINLG